MNKSSKVLGPELISEPILSNVAKQHGQKLDNRNITLMWPSVNASTACQTTV